MEYEIGDDPVLAAFAYSNGSSLPILVDEIEGDSNALLFGGTKSDIVSFRRNDFLSCQWTASDSNLVEMDKPTDSCGISLHRRVPSRSKMIQAKDFPISCADLLIQVDYRLEYQPYRQAAKALRLVTLPTSKGLKWVKESVEAKTDFCTVRSLQQTK